MAAYPGSVSPTEAIRFAARRRLKKARAYGFEGPPFCPRILASILGIKTRADSLPPGLDALLAPEPDGQLTIVWNESAPGKRANFSVAHEIGHTLFPSCAVDAQFRTQGGLNFHPDQFIERLCDIAAAELLMPLDDFRGDLAEHGATTASVLALSDRYQASPEAVALRMQALSPEPLAVARFEDAEQANVLYCVGNRAIRNVCAGLAATSELRPPMSSSVRAALSGGPPGAVATEVWDVAGASVTFQVDAMSLDSDEVARALVLLRPV